MTIDEHTRPKMELAIMSVLTVLPEYDRRTLLIGAYMALAPLDPLTPEMLDDMEAGLVAAREAYERGESVSMGGRTAFRTPSGFWDTAP